MVRVVATDCGCPAEFGPAWSEMKEKILMMSPQEKQTKQKMSKAEAARAAVFAQLEAEEKKRN